MMTVSGESGLDNGWVPGIAHIYLTLILCGLPAHYDLQGTKTLFAY
jgi:hypothetical protein